MHIRAELETCKLGGPYPRSMQKVYPFWASVSPLCHSGPPLQINPLLYTFYTITHELHPFFTCSQTWSHQLMIASSGDWNENTNTSAQNIWVPLYPHQAQHARCRIRQREKASDQSMHSQWSQKIMFCKWTINNVLRMKPSTMICTVICP